MKILVLNSGSSSLKFRVFEMETEKLLVKGEYEKVGLPDSFLSYKINGVKYKLETPALNHEQAIDVALKYLQDPQYGVIKSLDEIAAVGHRIVHGGEKFNKSVLINDEVMKAIEDCIELAPLHNPSGLAGIRACKKEMPNTPMVAVFDTAFHQTIPEERYLYPIPYKYYEKYGIRRYGFHGTSHRYVSSRAAEMINKPIENLKIITCHLGQGASLCAIDGGKSVDTSMGFTPVAGISMGTRSGDMDPSVVTFLMKKENLSPDEMDKILNKESGAYGISGVSPDFRDMERAAAEGNHRAIIALENFAYLVAQFIGRYAASMNGVDVIAFTGGVGEKGPESRQLICGYLNYLGVELDLEKNKIRGREAELSTSNSRIKIYTIPTEEELMIARDTKRIALDNRE